MASSALRLVVNADDFGLCPGVNEAVARLHRQGAITSASLLVNAPAAAHAVALARSLPGLGVGVHLCLVEETPLCPARGIPTLAGPGGALPPHATALARRLWLGQVREEDIARELTAQVAWVVDHGLRPTHLDSHQHTHVLPPVARVTAGLLRRFGIPRVRNLSRPVAAPAPTPRLGPLAHRGLVALARRAAAGALAPWSAPAAFWGLQQSGHLTPQALDHWLNACLKKNDGSGESGTPHALAELMAHPGDADPALTSRYHHWRYDWLADAATLATLPHHPALTTGAVRQCRWGEV